MGERYGTVYLLCILSFIKQFDCDRLKNPSRVWIDIPENENGTDVEVIEGLRNGRGLILNRADIDDTMIEVVRLYWNTHYVPSFFDSIMNYIIYCIYITSVIAMIFLIAVVYDAMVYKHENKLEDDAPLIVACHK